MANKPLNRFRLTFLYFVFALIGGVAIFVVTALFSNFLAELQIPNTSTDALQARRDSVFIRNHWTVYTLVMCWLSFFLWRKKGIDGIGRALFFTVVPFVAFVVRPYLPDYAFSFALILLATLALYEVIVASRQAKR